MVAIQYLMVGVCVKQGRSTRGSTCTFAWLTLIGVGTFLGPWVFPKCGGACAVHVHREVTILVANLVGTNAMAERYGNQLHVHLGPALDIILTAVRESKGNVLQWSGGIVLAAFNAVTTTRRHAETACMCALAIRSRMKAGQPAMAVQMALHTCSVLCGNIAAASMKTFNLFGCPPVQPSALCLPYPQRAAAPTLWGNPLEGSCSPVA